MSWTHSKLLAYRVHLLQICCISVLAGRVMASKETRFKSKISIQCGCSKVSMQRDRLSKHTHQQHLGLPIKEHGQTSLTDILSRKRPDDRENVGETNPTAKKKKIDGPDETQSGSTACC